jgi:hypothetical protein
MVLTARVLHESEASFSFMLQHLLMLQFCRIPISPSPSLQSLADWCRDPDPGSVLKYEVKSVCFIDDEF